MPILRRFTKHLRRGRYRVRRWWDDANDGCGRSRMQRVVRGLRDRGHSASSLLGQLGLYGVGLFLLGDVLINKIRLHEFASAGFNSLLATAAVVAAARIATAGRGIDTAPKIRPIDAQHRPPSYSAPALLELSLLSPASAREVVAHSALVTSSDQEASPVHVVTNLAMVPIVLNPHSQAVVVIGDDDLVTALTICEAEAVRTQSPIIELSDVVAACVDIISGSSRCQAARPEPFPVIMHPRSRAALLPSPILLTTGGRQRFQRRDHLESAFRIAWLGAAALLAVAAAERLLILDDDVRDASRIHAGEEAIASGDLSTADELFTSALRDRPESRRAALGLVCVASKRGHLDDWLVHAGRALAEGASLSSISRCLPATNTLGFEAQFAQGGPILTITVAPAPDEIGQLTRVDGTSALVGDVAARAACEEARARLFSAFATHAFVTANVPDGFGRRSGIDTLRRCEDDWDQAPLASEVRAWLSR